MHQKALYNNNNNNKKTIWIIIYYRSFCHYFLSETKGLIILRARAVWSGSSYELSNLEGWNYNFIRLLQISMHKYYKMRLYDPRNMKQCFLGIYGQRRPRSDCTFAQSDQGLHCPHTKSTDTVKCIDSIATSLIRLFGFAAWSESLPFAYIPNTHFLMARLIVIFHNKFFHVGARSGQSWRQSFVSVSTAHSIHTL